MAARLTDKQKKKILADYAETQSYSATGKMNGVAHNTVIRLVRKNPDMAKMIQEKNTQNTEDVLKYMEGKRQLVCEIIDKALIALNDEEKLSTATPPQITTAIGTLIDKWALLDKSDSEKQDSGVTVVIDV